MVKQAEVTVEFIDVQAERTRCYGDKQTRVVTVRVERYYQKELSSWWIRIKIGGVTGYESMREDNVKEHCKIGWCACAGTDGRYDKLSLPAESMQQIQDWLEQG